MIKKAKQLLSQGQYTCVVCGENLTLTATERGVAPLAQWLREGKDLTGCVAADKVVGKATAFLYCLLGVTGVYARVMSHQALEVLRAHGIAAECDIPVAHIINRAGTGMCPFEEAVWEVTEPAEAWQIIQRKLRQGRNGMKILVSACLLGRNCKYNGGNNYDERVVEFLKDKEVIEICPEVLAGLGVPRTPIEIVNGTVLDRSGNNVDAPLRSAVEQILAQIKGQDIQCAILKSRSPTCGVRQVYDGTFTGTLVDGSGILAKALLDAGYTVLDAEELK